MNRILGIFARLITIPIFIFFIVALCFDIDISENHLSILVILASVLEVLIVLTNNRIYKTGILAMFFVYNVLCANGFVIASFFDSQYYRFKSVTSMSFLNLDSYSTAILIANVVLLSFAYANDFVVRFGRNKLDNFASPYYWKEHQRIESKDVGSSSIDAVGITLLSIGTMYIVYITLRYGLFGAGYTYFLSVTENMCLYGHVIVINALAVAFVISAGTNRGAKIAVVIFIIYAIFQFSMGNRGEIMYAAVICVALLSMRFKKNNIKKVIVCAIILVFLIPFIRVMRTFNLSEYTLNPFTSLLDTLCEEGMQISPFTFIVNYVEAGNGHVWGLTYLNDFWDFICRRFGTTSGLYTGKYVIKMIMPYDGMGFMMMAELYYNFTVVGAALVYVLIAKALCKLDYLLYTNNISTTKKIFFSMLAVQMINMTRNDASTLPIYLMYMLIFILLYYVYTKFFTQQIN